MPKAPYLSMKSEIHTIEVLMGQFNNRFKLTPNPQIEETVCNKYGLGDCSEQNDYNNYLSNKNIPILKEGKYYRIISVQEGIFKIKFGFGWMDIEKMSLSKGEVGTWGVF